MKAPWCFNVRNKPRELRWPTRPIGSHYFHRVRCRAYVVSRDFVFRTHVRTYIQTDVRTPCAKIMTIYSSVTRGLVDQYSNIVNWKHQKPMDSMEFAIIKNIKSFLIHRGVGLIIIFTYCISFPQNLIC